MKKLIFLAVLAAVILLPAVQSYGQAQTWGPWGNVGCFNGIQVRARRSGDEPGKFGYTWYIQFRNNYSQKVAFGFTMQANSQASDEYIKVNGGQYRTELEANTTDSGLMSSQVNNFSSLNVKLGYFRFIKTGEIDVSQPFERCDDGTNAIDDLCAFKPASSCANYKKPVDKTAAANSTDSRKVNKTPATLAQCNVLMKTYKASVDKVDSTEAGLAKGKSLVSSGEEILNRCKTRFAKSVFGEIEGKVADAKEFLAGYDEEPNQDSIATLGGTTTETPDLSAQKSNPFDGQSIEELRKIIIANIKMNALFTRDSRIKNYLTTNSPDTYDLYQQVGRIFQCCTPSELSWENEKAKITDEIVMEKYVNYGGYGSTGIYSKFNEIELEKETRFKLPTLNFKNLEESKRKAKDPNYENFKAWGYWSIFYDFGANDANFIELQQAIEALKKISK